MAKERNNKKGTIELSHLRRLSPPCGSREESPLRGAAAPPPPLPNPPTDEAHPHVLACARVSIPRRRSLPDRAALQDLELRLLLPSGIPVSPPRVFPWRWTGINRLDVLIVINVFTADSQLILEGFLKTLVCGLHIQEDVQIQHDNSSCYG